MRFRRAVVLKTILICHTIYEDFHPAVLVVSHSKQRSVVRCSIRISKRRNIQYSSCVIAILHEEIYLRRSFMFSCLPFTSGNTIQTKNFVKHPQHFLKTLLTTIISVWTPKSSLRRLERKKRRSERILLNAHNATRPPNQLQHMSLLRGKYSTLAESINLCKTRLARIYRQQTRHVFLSDFLFYFGLWNRMENTIFKHGGNRNELFTKSLQYSTHLSEIKQHIYRTLSVVSLAKASTCYVVAVLCHQWCLCHRSSCRPLSWRWLLSREKTISTREKESSALYLYVTSHSGSTPDIDKVLRSVRMWYFVTRTGLTT